MKYIIITSQGHFSIKKKNCPTAYSFCKQVPSYFLSFSFIFYIERLFLSGCDHRAFKYLSSFSQSSCCPYRTILPDRNFLSLKNIKKWYPSSIYINFQRYFLMIFYSLISISLLWLKYQRWQLWVIITTSLLFIYL